MKKHTTAILEPSDFVDGRACAKEWQSRLASQASLDVLHIDIVIINNRIVKNRPTGRVGRIKSPQKH